MTNNISKENELKLKQFVTSYFDNVTNWKPSAYGFKFYFSIFKATQLVPIPSHVEIWMIERVGTSVKFRAYISEKKLEDLV